MKTLAKKLAAKESLNRRNSHLRQTPTPEAARVSPLFHSPAIVQRVSACACGGGCPRCAGVIQSKLTIGRPNDKYEQEADHAVADLPAPAISGIPTDGSGSAPSLQRSANEEPEEELQRQPEEEEEPIQAKLIQRKMTDMRGIQPSRFGYVGPKAKAQQAEIHRILRTTGAQAKLTISQPNDKYEQEADRVAEQVMWMPGPRMQQTCPNGAEEETVQTSSLANQITPLVQRQAEPEEEKEKETAQTKPFLQCQVEPEEGEEEQWVQAKNVGIRTTPVNPVLSAGVQGLRGKGQPLPKHVRSYFEPRFGYDFVQVRVHTDQQATDMARYMKARAFTFGHHIVFGAGAFAPKATAGQRLLAHELTHIVQQGSERHFSTSQNPLESESIATTLPRNRIARWKILGNTATVTKRGDRLWNLAKQITGHGRDWACIWPVEMKSPKAWEDDFERYIQIGDRFDTSNLTLTTGPSATFTFQGTDVYLRAIQALYGGTDVFMGNGGRTLHGKWGTYVRI